MIAASLYRRAIPAEARVTRWRAADGWDLRRFDWPAHGAAPRGSILFQVGRGDMFEKYLEAFAHWHARGWSVSSFDWRGQGGSGRLSPDPRVGHCDDFGSLVGDLDDFWREWTEAAPEPRIVIGHSMGAHLVLQAMLEASLWPHAAVLVAPMLGLKSPLGARGGEAVARWMTRIGDPKRAAWKGNERPHTRLSRQSLLTHDRERYADELWWHAAQPDNQTGPPSWAWLATAFAATRTQRADPRLERMDVPTLLLVPLADRLVDPRAAVAVAGKLPDAELLTWGAESAHEILREADRVRAEAIAAIDAFLDQRVPAR